MQKYIRNSGIIDSDDNERLKKGTTKMLKNPEQTKNEIVEWIRDYFKKNGPDCDAVVGVSAEKIPVWLQRFWQRHLEKTV